VVVIAGRSAKRLGAAQAELGCPGRLRAVTADIGDRAEAASLFERTATIRHLVVTTADLPNGPGHGVTEDALMRAVQVSRTVLRRPGSGPPDADRREHRSLPPALPHTGPRQAVR
jgi:hypothetical protein